VTGEAYLALHQFAARLAGRGVNTGRTSGMVQMVSSKEGVLEQYRFDKLRRDYESK
jgi:hypothetical protein